MKKDRTIRRVISALSAIATSLVRAGWDQANVSDASQELIVRVLERPALLQRLEVMPDLEMRRYLFGALRNEVRDLLRKERRLITAAVELPDDIPDKSNAEEELEAWISLTRAIHRLPHPYREVLDLFFLKKSDAKSIAKALGRRLPAVYQQINRGQEKLRATWPQRKKGR